LFAPYQYLKEIDMSNLQKIASILRSTADDLRADNDAADRRAALDKMVEQVKADMVVLGKIHKQVFPKGCAISIEQEKALMAGCFPIVGEKK